LRSSDGNNDYPCSFGGVADFHHKSQEYHVVRDHILWMPAHPPHLRFAVIFFSDNLVP
jgi:hypothetical protein